MAEWEGLEAWGEGEVKFDNSPVPVHASWRITCLALDGPVDESQFLDQTLVQVLTLWVEEATKPGFTISFHRSGIIQLDPHPSNFNTIVANKSFWRTPSQLSISSTNLKAQDAFEEHMQTVNGQQQSLHVPFIMLGHFIKWEIKIIKEAAHGAVKSCRHHFAWLHEGFHNFTEGMHDRFCQKEPYNSNSLSIFLGKSTHASPLPLEKVVKGSAQPHPSSATATEPLDSTDTFPSPTTSQTRSPSQTRSLSFEESGSTDNFRAIDPDFGSVIDYVKPITIILLIASLLMLIMKYLRDPRRRADCAARREERRNRRLYRRAAQMQKLRNWFRSFRSNYCPITRVVDSWDEKRIRVIEQEDVLESVMKDEICALRHAHRVVSGVSAAEEGRNNYIYEAEASERRRSVVTLPGYESEGAQPPRYEENRIRAVDAFRYTLAESEDTPDSSVISTSPRISRDERDSDFAKELEWSLESRPRFGFQA